MEKNDSEQLPQDFVEHIEKMAIPKHGRPGGLLFYSLTAYIRPLQPGEIFGSQISFKMVGTPPFRQPDISFVIKDHHLRVKADFAPDWPLKLFPRAMLFTRLKPNSPSIFNLG